MMKKVIAPSIALLLACWNLEASTLVWDTGAGAGIQAGTGNWDFNATSNWTLDSGANRVNWTNNADTALFQLTGNTGTVSVAGSGQVGTNGLFFSGTVGSPSGVWTLNGNSLQLGGGGLVNGITDGVLLVNAPLVLTQSQTWTSTRLSANNGTAGVRANGAISSLAGTTNLTFDGRGLSSPTSTANALTRVIFSMGGANSYAGTTTVTGGAALRLDYTSNAGGKLDDNRALILGGSTIVLNGGSAVTEVVGSTLIASGANNIFAGPNGGGGSANKIQLGAITRNVGGTLDVTNAVSGIASTITGNTNGIIGGWATVGGTSWAVGSATGEDVAIGSTNGSTRSTVASWGTGENVNATAGGSLTADKVINALRFASTSAANINLAGFTLTTTSGGVINNFAGNTITGGKLTTGASTGELFVHTPTALSIGSEISNNGSTPTVLVKGGASSLTLTGVNTYTGGTIINAGSLIVASGGVIGGSVLVQGGATFDVSANGFTVASGSNLSGSGAILGNVSVSSGGTLSTGTSLVDDQGATKRFTGTLSLGNNLSLMDGSIVSLGLGTNSDLVALSNASAVLTGSGFGGITLNLSDAGGVAVSQVYTLFQWQAGTTLSGFDLTDFSVNGLSGTLQFGTNSLEFIVTAVPEPSTYAMLILGLGAMVWVHRVRRRALVK